MLLEGGFAIDTNIAIYASAAEPKTNKASRLLFSGPVISVQVLNEFANVSLRKRKLERSVMLEALDLIKSSAASVEPILIEDHMRATELIHRYMMSFYDALIVAVALRSNVSVLYTEDMQDGLTVENTLHIRNPFAMDTL